MRRSRYFTHSRRQRPIYGHRLEALESRLMLASDWQNPVIAANVDGIQGTDPVSPLDALVIINELTSPTVSNPLTGQLPDLGPGTGSPPPYFDVDGNNVVSPLDALHVINALPANVVDDSNDDNDPPRAPNSVIVGMPLADEVGFVDDTRVNTVTRHLQKYSDVDTNANGQTVVVWSSLAQDGWSWGAFGQRYATDGSRVGDEFQINQFTKHSQRDPVVAVYDDGSFIVAWKSLGQDGSGWGVYARTFDAQGNPTSGDIRVNTTTQGTQWHPDVAIQSADSTAVVAWRGRGVGDNDGIFTSTLPLGANSFTGEVRMNTLTRHPQERPAITGLANGYAVAWHGRGLEEDDNGISVRVVNNGSTNSSFEFLANNSSNRTEKRAAIDFNDNGQLVVAWQGHRQGEPGWGIQARLVDISSAQPVLGNTINVNQTTNGNQQWPDVAFLEDGSFVTTWFGKGRGDNLGVFSRQFSTDGNDETNGINGTALGNEMLVNWTTQAVQAKPAITSANQGYIITWHGKGTSDNFGVFARFVDADEPNPFRLDPIPDMTVDEGDTVSFTATITDTDMITDVVTFSLAPGAPPTAAIDANTGVFTWTTTEEDGPGTFPITVNASDGTFTDSQSFNVNVLEVNLPPVIEPIEDQTAQVGQPFSLLVMVSDPDIPANTITLMATQADGNPLPTWLNFETTTGLFSGTPADGDVGMLDVLVTATDNGGLSDTEDFTITVLPQVTLMLDIPNQTTVQDALFVFDVTPFLSGNEPGDTITWSATADGGGPLPGWLSLDSATGVFSGTPMGVDVGSSDIRVVATAASGALGIDTYTLTVTAINVAPVINDQFFRINPPLTAGDNVGTVIAGDSNPQDTLTFSITAGNDAGNFAIDSATGQITIADPTGIADGDTSTITVQVSDGSETDMADVQILNSSTAQTVAYTLQTFNTDGVEASSFQPDELFDVALFVEDLQAVPTGVFSAFADMIYQVGAVAVAGEIVHSSVYSAATSGLTNQSGLVDEAGGLDGLNFLGGGAMEVWRLRFRALQSGTFVFTSDPTEDMVQHGTLVFGEQDEKPVDELSFGSASITIGGNGNAMPTPSSSNFELGVRDEILVIHDRPPTGPVAEPLPSRPRHSAAGLDTLAVDQLAASYEAEELFVDDFAVDVTDQGVEL